MPNMPKMPRLPKTAETLRQAGFERIGNFVDNPLTIFQPTEKIEQAKAVQAWDNRITAVEEVQKQMVQKLLDETRRSAVFDYFHQTSPRSIAPHVMQQLYGKDLFFLRDFYKQCSPIDQIIFHKRFSQLRTLAKCVGKNPNRIGWRVVHKSSHDDDFKVTPDIEKKCRWFEGLIQSPHSISHPGGFPEVLVAMAEAMMLFDRVVIEKLEHAQYRGTGVPASYIIPDAATIKPTTWVLHALAGSKGYTGRDEEARAREIAEQSVSVAEELTGKSLDGAIQKAGMQIARHNATPDHYEISRLRQGLITWVQQMPDKMISAGYTDNDICVFIANPNVEINGWGWSSGSAFERSLAFGEVIWKMTGLNKEIFDSRMPEGLLTIVNQGVDKRQKQQLQERMVEEGTDRFSNILVQYVADPEKDIKYQKLKDKPTDMQFERLFNLYVKLKCSPYGMDYTLLNLEDGKSGGLGGSGSHEKRMDEHTSTGLESDANYLADCITKALIKPWSPDYQMEFVFDVSETVEKIEINTKKQAYISLAELRQTENLNPDWWKNAPKESQELLKQISAFTHIPSFKDGQLIQVVNKILDQNFQREQAELEQKQEEQEAVMEGQEPEEQPTEEEEQKLLEESKEIQELKAILAEMEGEEPEEELSKSLTVQHRWV